MNLKNLMAKFYLDKEKDIVVKLFKSNEDELTYIIETPNHHTGNLITNLSKVAGVKTVKNENDMKIITGTLYACINDEAQELYIFRLGGIKIANIYPDGKVERIAKIPAIIKLLMAQTKDYKLPIEKTIIKSYIYKKSKFRTDLHTHLNQILQPDLLIALGIKHQIGYSLYYINKLGIKVSKEQQKLLEIKRKETEKIYINSDLSGKKLERKINDETQINLADLILNNLKDSEENIKIRNSLVLLKDGQAVFTNLEKTLLYRYAIIRGKQVREEERVKLELSKIEQLEDYDIKETLKKMIEDSKKGSKYENNTLYQDKLLWIAREYQKQGIKYIEIANSTLSKKGEMGIMHLAQMHEVMPKIEEETGVSIRYLAAASRTLFTEEQLKEGIDVLKVAAKSPYIVGSDIIGEEINDIRNFKQVLKELVEFAIEQDDGFTIRVHAGENDSFKENVERAIECIKKAVPEGKKMPRCRIGHGLYGIDLETENGKKLVEDLKKDGVILEFQLTSNVRLNNLTDLSSHPIKRYLANNVNCVQGTDGCGFYGTDCMEEQMALTNLLNLTDEDLAKMKKVEDDLIAKNDEYFKIKSKKFEEWLNGRDIKDAILQEELAEIEKNKNRAFSIGRNTDIDSAEILKEKIVKLPQDKVPIIIAGGSFNSKGRETVITERGKELLKELVEKLDSEKAYFVIGHKMQGYEKAIIDISKEVNKKFEIDAIIPKKVTKELAEMLVKNDLNGVCISTESEELGIYKSFNYEIFERRKSIVIAFDGNSPVLNLVQEAKNGKGKSKIYVNQENELLKEKADTLEGYVVPFKMNDNIAHKIFEENPEILK